MGVISRLRGAVDRWGSSLAPLLAKVTPNPNYYTLAGVVAAFAAAASAYQGLVIASVLLILLSGALDAVDGLVARHLGRASSRGAFLDSVMDRVSDTLYHIALVFLLEDALPVMLSLSASLITPYLRARGEALGMKMAGIGLVERQERVVALAAIGLASGYSEYYASLGMWLLAIVAWITVAQRGVHVYNRLKEAPHPETPTPQ